MSDSDLSQEHRELGYGKGRGKRKACRHKHIQRIHKVFVGLFLSSSMLASEIGWLDLNVFFSQDNSDETSALTILCLCFILLLDVKQKWSFRLLYFISNASLFSLITFKSPWPSIMSWKGLNCQ